MTKNGNFFCKFCQNFYFLMKFIKVSIIKSFYVNIYGKKISNFFAKKHKIYEKIFFVNWPKLAKNIFFEKIRHFYDQICNHQKNILVEKWTLLLDDFFKKISFFLKKINFLTFFQHFFCKFNCFPIWHNYFEKKPIFAQNWQF